MKISAITYLDETGKQRIYAFAQGKYGTLHVNYWDGKQWQWADQGQPAGQLRYEVAAISYQEGALQRIYAFTPA
ncbi:MAG TPA: hypothetical protein VE732_04655, partial [Nitrososphaera sp.]|nr:hypothetical protein [Nitrososphaera sp.]